MEALMFQAVGQFEWWTHLPTHLLTNLSLRNNEIRPEGAVAIAKALRGNGVLAKLALGGNHIGDEGINDVDCDPRWIAFPQKHLNTHTAPSPISPCGW